MTKQNSIGTTLVWEQTDYDGRIIRLSKTFETQDEKFQWIKDMRTSAREIGKYFQIITLED